ncbi:MAG: preprotein translocase subunit YajC [Candidatus Azosocius agrarius]|nr:MAG: preprotein translocase subunit YajC [Gammaproteobacteria bacterium]
MKFKFFVFFASLFYPCLTFADSGSTMNNENFISLLIFGVFFVFIYFYMIRPQSKREKALKILRNNLIKGDEVIILNGVLATIVDIKDQWVTVSISDNCCIVIQKNAIMQEVPKGTIKSKLLK